MSYINIAEWTPTHVVQWLQGLDDCIQPYVNFFLDSQVNGCRLLLLTSEDLDKLSITKIGHQEIILDSVDLLKHLHYNCTSENLQTLALKLGCKSRSLYNHLRKEKICGICENCLINLQSPPQSSYENENEENELYSNLFQQYKKSNVVIRKSITASKRMLCRKITTYTLASVCDILNSVKQFITWIDRYSFEVQDYYSKIRQTIIRISIELASTAQRDHFVENPKELIKNNCLKFAEICERIVQELNDSLCIQPACLEMVPIRHKENEELGVKIYSSFRNVHVIGEIKMQSPVHRCGRIEEGDEIAQINYQTVLGWTERKLIEAMKEYPTKILITVKKGPSHSRIAGQLKVLEPNKIPHRAEPIIANTGCKFDSGSISKRIIFQQQNNQNNTGAINNPCETNTTATHKQLIEQISIEKPHKGPVYQMSKEIKPKRKELKRRATICGTSPHLSHNQNAPICLEDLMNLNDHDDYDDNLDEPDYNLNMYKSYCNLQTPDYQDNQEQIKRKANLNKRTLSSDAELKKRSISAYGYDKIYYDFTNNNNRTKNGRKQNVNNDTDYCLIRNGDNNATVISINSSNIMHVQCNDNDNDELVKSKSQSHKDEEEHSSPDLKINNKEEGEDGDKHLKPKEEVLKRKKSQAKLIKNLNLNCKQLRDNSDHCGFLNYLREELHGKGKNEGEDDDLSDHSMINNNKSSLNNSFNKFKPKWKRNYFILKNELLYFYQSNDDNQEPSRIINLPIFSLDDKIDYSTNGLNLFKIASLKHAFYFGSKDLTELNEWIEKFRIIINNHSNNVKNLKIVAQTFKDLNLNDQNNKQQLLPKHKNNGITNTYSFNNGTRSISCVDSNFLDKYSRNKEPIVNQSIENFHSSLPPPIPTQANSRQQLYLEQLNRQNHNNQVIEQNQNNHRKEIPKPQPRFSKMKQQQQQQQQSDSNFVGKIINSFDELSKQCEKELDYYSSLRKKTVVNNDNKPTRYVSVLDQEYDKLFKHKSPPPSNNIRTATSKEIQSIYLKQPKRCNSPITSDHSSSSGISSYYSLNNNNNQNQDLSSNDTSTLNFSFSPNSTLDKDSSKNTSKPKEKDKKQVQRKSSFNSFRLFGSSKVLSKLSGNSSSFKETESAKQITSLTSPRPKRSFFGLRKNSLPMTNSKSSTNQTTTTPTNNKTNHLNRKKSKSSELLNNYIDHLSAEDFYLLQQEKFKKSNMNRPEYFTLNTPRTVLDRLTMDNTCYDNNAILPEIPRSSASKPCMGISLKLMNKRRSSTVSCDRVAIEQAIQLHNEKLLMQNN